MYYITLNVTEEGKKYYANYLMKYVALILKFKHLKRVNIKIYCFDSEVHVSK